MRSQQLNRTSIKVLIGLSLIALLTVITGYFQPPQTDEGAGAHIFQLSIVLVVPTLLLFVVTADWRQPWKSAQQLAVPFMFLVLAFGALYYLEHYRWAQSNGNRVDFWLYNNKSPEVMLNSFLSASSSRLDPC